MHPPPDPRSAPPADSQDVVNTLLAAAVQAGAVLSQTCRVAALTAAAGRQQTAAHLAETAAALMRIRDAMLRTADAVAAREHL